MENYGGFQAWPKTVRFENLFLVIEEKLDGSNSGFEIRDGQIVGIQSRKRLITPESDNFGFARWVREREDVLVDTLGDGRHYGEYWGSGIQRTYGLTTGDKRFSRFNSARWASARDHFESLGIGLSVVPTLFHGKVGPLGIEGAIERSLATLRHEGSQAQPGFMNPEGVIVNMLDFQSRFKVIPSGWEPDSKSATRG
jgi:hypothetical protein